ncbi:unnamed protein product [Rhizopus stolonifer]
MALTISVTFSDKQVHRVQLIPEKLSWENLVTILQLSTPQLSNKDNLELFYLHPVTQNDGSISDQESLEELLEDIKMPYIGLCFSDSIAAPEPLLLISPIERLAQWVNENAPLGQRVSRLVGILASQMASSPEKNFDRSLEWLGNQIKEEDFIFIERDFEDLERHSLPHHPPPLEHRRGYPPGEPPRGFPPPPPFRSHPPPSRDYLPPREYDYPYQRESFGNHCYCGNFSENHEKSRHFGQR